MLVEDHGQTETTRKNVKEFDRLLGQLVELDDGQLGSIWGGDENWALPTAQNAKHFPRPTEDPGRYDLYQTPDGYNPPGIGCDGTPYLGCDYDGTAMYNECAVVWVSGRPSVVYVT